VVAGRIANRFDLRGTNCVTDAACASALSALSMGLLELASGQSDLVITGGVDTMNDIFMYMCFSKTPALSRSGDCRPFSDAADGTLLGEGIVMVALKRLADAEAAGDRVYAVIRGLGSSSDGRSKSVYAPLPEGQARALERTYAVAGYGPETVELVEAHGTATRAGDAAEFAGLQMVFNKSKGKSDDLPWCALGSVKSQIGHLKSAAGAVGLFKAVMALQHKVLPPIIKVDRPNPALGIEGSPFYLNTRSRPWIRDSSHPRRASVSSFGFGGSNFHVTLEEYRGPAPQAWRVRTDPTELVMLSGETAAGLAKKCAEFNSFAGGLVELARASQAGFRATDRVRLAIVAGDVADLGNKLTLAREHLLRGEAPLSTPTGVHVGIGDAAGQIGFLFPGQGSQYVDMTADVVMRMDAARTAWDECAGLRFDGSTLHSVVFPRPVFTEEDREAQAQRLTATEWAQPALGMASLGLLAVLRAAGVEATHVGGHSFGELTALVAAGVLSATDLMMVGRRRGELMRAGPGAAGTMTAVPRTIDEVRADLAGLTHSAVVANHNHPTQVVLSGTTEDIARVEQHLAGKGVTARRLTVANAFHSPLVAPACGAFADFLMGVAFASPTIPVWSNSTAAPHDPDPRAIRGRIAAQIAEPVRFVEQIEAMWRAGVRTFIEVGPGAVLTDLVGRILEGRPHAAVALDRKSRNGVTSLQEGLGRLATLGVAVDFSVLWAGYAPAATKPAKQPAMTIMINGANHNKPYPPPGGAADLPRPNPPRPHGTESAPAHAAPAPMAAGSSEVQAAWVHAYQESQAQTAEVHATYLKMMADSHSAFLRTVETSFSGLSAILGGQPIEMAAPLPVSPRPVVSAPAPVYVAPRAVVAAPVVAAPVYVAAPVVVAPTPVAAAPKQDLEVVLLGVVAEMTGYPRETLGLHMELEADLGIDSIKRVEILSGFREQAPGLPEVNASEMAALRTLGQIVEFMRGSTGGSAKPAENFKGPAKSGEPTTPADTVKTVEARVTRNVSRRFVAVPVAAAAAGLGVAGLLGARWVAVTDCGEGLASHVVRLLGERGVNAEVADAMSGDADAVLFLGGLRRVGTIDEAIAVNREAFRVAHAVAPRFAAKGGLFVTVQDTGGDFGATGRDELRAWLAGVSALARTAAIEWPDAVVKAIDLERGDRSPEAVARALVEELFGGGATREVGLRADGSRTTLRSLARDVVAGATVVHSKDVVVVSGGGRGVTAASIAALARHAHPRLVLLGRSSPSDEPAACRGVTSEGELKRVLFQDAKGRGQTRTPAELGAEASRVLANREVSATIAELRACGSEVRYIAVDVGDRARVREALNEVRRDWGPITGVVHGAGVLADRRIADKTIEQFDRVFDAKVVGLRALLEATAEDPLRWIVVYSSVAARTGNAGQSDYAMANEVLNKVTASIRTGRAGIVAKSIGWGPWEGGMVTPQLAARFELAGVGMLPLAEGARRFVEEIEGSPDEVETVIGGAAGDGPLGASRGPSMMSEVVVEERTHRYIGDHRLAGKPVVPLAVVLDWLARAARSYRADPGPIVMRDLRVLRGIKLDRFDSDGESLCRGLQAGRGRGADARAARQRRIAALQRGRRGGEGAAGGDGAAADARGVVGGADLRRAHAVSWAAVQVIESIDGVSREGIDREHDRGARARVGGGAVARGSGGPRRGAAIRGAVGARGARRGLAADGGRGISLRGGGCARGADPLRGPRA
jgi:acyl transferase domain-containing protein/NADP-dependent 3-hydroxy acid dehydrogenase YdfG